MSGEEVCEDIPTKIIIAMVMCIAGVVSIVIALGFAILKIIVLNGHLALLLIMLMVTLFACVPSISMYGTYKYAECLNNELARKINEWLQAIEQRGGE
jgi:uncharacterized Tic20 family protein